MKPKLKGYSVYLDPALDQAIITYLKDQRNVSATLRAWVLVGFAQRSNSDRPATARINSEQITTDVEAIVSERLAEMAVQVMQLPQVIRQIVEASLTEALAGHTLSATLQTENEPAADLLAAFDGQLLID